MRTSDSKSVIGIFCSDIHLSLKAPISRIEEPDWFMAMKRPLDQLKALKKELDCPIFFAGDLFDRWNSSPELINFAIKNVPPMFAVPGQHDLPLHNYHNIKKSAYWTLVEAGIVENVVPGEVVHLAHSNIDLYGFPWGFPIHPLSEEDQSDSMKIAIVHHYIWISDHNYPGAPKEDKLTKTRKDMKGFNVVAFGDNHIGFMSKRGNTQIFNCGGFMRRKADQFYYKPQIGILWNDGTVEPHYLDCKFEKMEPVVPTIDPGEDMELQQFLKDLAALEETHLDFKDAMKRAFSKIKPNKEIREMILEAME